MPGPFCIAPTKVGRYVVAVRRYFTSSVPFIPAAKWPGNVHM